MELLLDVCDTRRDIRLRLFDVRGGNAVGMPLDAMGGFGSLEVYDGHVIPAFDTEDISP